MVKDKNGKTQNKKEWTEEYAIEYLSDIGVPISPDGSPLGI